MDDSVDHVLEAIDNAVQDWEVSDDAMRWTPEPPEEKETETYIQWVSHEDWARCINDQVEAMLAPWLPHEFRASALFSSVCAECGQPTDEARHTDQAQPPVSWDEMQPSCIMGQMIDLSGFTVDVRLENEHARFEPLPDGRITFNWDTEE